MKKILEFLKYFVLFFVVFLFISCSDVISGFVFDKEDENTSKNYMYITLESENKLHSQTGSRSINAPIIEFSTASQNYVFYIWGKSSTDTVSPRKVNFNASSDNTGTVEIDFPLSTYAFILAVTENEIPDPSASLILEKAIFVGYSNADLTYSRIIKFSLTTDGLKGKGSVNLNYHLDNTWTDDEFEILKNYYTISVGIYKKESLVPETVEHAIYFMEKSSVVSGYGWFSEVLAGTYDLIVTIRNASNADLVYYYSDKITFAPNRTISAEFYIPNVVMNVPDAPEDFKAAACMDYRIYNGSAVVDNNDGTYSSVSGINLTSDSQVDGYNFNGYGLLLSWADKANNEQGFRITLIDVSKISTAIKHSYEFVAEVPEVITDSYWQTLINGYESNQDVVKIYNSDNYLYSFDYLGGSLRKNSKGMLIYASFGSCYIAKIEAVNSVGVSKACYAKLDENISISLKNELDDSKSGLYTGTAFSTPENKSNVINRFKIVYYLNEGCLYKSLDNRTAPEFIIDYCTYGTNAILCPSAQSADSATEETPALLNVNAASPLYLKPWRLWKYNSINGQNLIGANVNGTQIEGETIIVNELYSYQKANAYTGYVSLYLFAKYD